MTVRIRNRVTKANSAVKLNQLNAARAALAAQAADLVATVAAEEDAHLDAITLLNEAVAARQSAIADAAARASAAHAILGQLGEQV